MVEAVGSLSNSLSEANKDDVNAEGVGSPSVFLSIDEQDRYRCVRIYK